MAGTSHSVVDCLSTYNSTSGEVIMTPATPITITELSELCSSARNLTFRQEQAKHVESSCAAFVALFYVCSLWGNICSPLLRSSFWKNSYFVFNVLINIVKTLASFWPSFSPVPHFVLSTARMLVHRRVKP